MSKKRLYKKNIKTKKKIKGGLEGLEEAAVDSTNKLSDELGGVVNKIDGVVGATRNNAIDSLNAARNNAIGAVGAVDATALGATALGAVTNNPFEKFGKGALDKLKKGLQFIKGSLTPEDKYRHALLKLRKNPGFKNYFATAVNKVIVLNFYKVLIELGKYSRNYSDISKEIFEITGENMFDEDDDLYSELNEESSVLNEESSVSEGSKETDCVQDNTDKILSDENIEKFLNDTIILCIPVIKQNFKSLENIIEDYKKLKGKMNGLLEKAERENNVEKYFDDFRILSDEAIEQINAIFNDFDTSKMSGGKMSGGKEIDNIEDDFYDALLKMSIGNRDNFSKLLKQKLHGILNKIIKQLYDIANCEKIIDSNNEYDNDEYDEYDMKFLEKAIETSDFNIDEFKNRISERIGDLEKKQESLKEKQSDFDKKAEENYDNFKKPFTKLFGKSKDGESKDLSKDGELKDGESKDGKSKDGESKDLSKDDKKKGGAKFFLPEAMREEANVVSDSLSMVESQTEIQKENLEIVKLQETLIKIIQKMICKIQKNSNIDLDPFKNIVKPAFIEKKMQFRNLFKIWSKDYDEKRDLLIQLNEALNKDSKEKKDLVTQESFEEVLETKEYMKKIQTQIDIAVKKQEEIKEYIKTKEEKQKEIDAAKAAKEAKLKADAEAKLKAEAKDEAEKIRISAENTKISNELEQQKRNSNEKENIERLNKEQKRVEDEINYGVRRIKAEQEEKAKLDKQKKIYAKQGLMSRERLDKDIQEKANAEIKKKQQEIENELKKNNEKIKAESEEAAKMIKAAEEAKKAKEQLQNEINKKNNDNIKNLIEKEKKEKEKNKKRIEDIQAENQKEAKANKLDPFAGGRTTRKFSSPVSRKTRRRKQTSR